MGGEKREKGNAVKLLILVLESSSTIPAINESVSCLLQHSLELGSQIQEKQILVSCKSDSSVVSPLPLLIYLLLSPEQQSHSISPERAGSSRGSRRPAAGSIIPEI